MNRRTNVPDDLNDSRPVDGRSKPPAAGEPWTDALHELHGIARGREAATAFADDEQKSAPSSDDVEEALAALRALARREGPSGTPAFAPHVDAADEAQAEVHFSAYEQTDDEPDTVDFDEPSPGVRLLLRTRPSAASTALILVSAAVLAMLLVGAHSLARQLFHAGDIAPPAPAARSDAPAPAAATSVVSVLSPPATGLADLRGIEKAMADCDAEAAANPDDLYFFIVPAVSPTKDYTIWAPLSVGDIGSSVILLRSKDALDGLRNRSLAIYPAPYKFSIIDATADVTHSWPSVPGIAKFIKRDAATMAAFRVRFGFADVVGDTPSDVRFPRQKGVCYWVSALLRA